MTEPSQFRESLRYEYLLTPASIVIDLGFHRGEFAREIRNRYKCKVFAFEPIKQFCDEANQAGDLNGITLTNAAVGATPREAEMYVHGVKSGLYDTGPAVAAKIISLEQAMEIAGSENASLLKINIEGMEYELMDHMLSCGLCRHFSDIQIQFHPLWESSQRHRESIVERLTVSHEPTYCFPWIWENYRLRN